MVTGRGPSVNAGPAARARRDGVAEEDVAMQQLIDRVDATVACRRR
jgi:hypothetical protein